MEYMGAALLPGANDDLFAGLTVPSSVMSGTLLPTWIEYMLDRVGRSNSPDQLPFVMRCQKDARR